MDAPKLDFMVVSLPRSGSTWLANFLTFGNMRCFHDPCAHRPYNEIDSLCRPGIITGVADTGLWLFPQWVNAHPARKIVLLRDPEEINESMDDLGWGDFDAEKCVALLNQIDGLRVEWDDMFHRDGAEDILEYIFKERYDMPPFDRYRHTELAKYNIEPVLPFDHTWAAADYNRRHAQVDIDAIFGK